MPLYQIVALQQWNAQEVRNVFYYESSDVLSTEQLEDAADAVRAAWATWNTANGFDNAWTLYGIEARRVDLAGLPTLPYAFTSGALVGSNASTNPFPTQIALLVSFSAPTAFPRRARSYLAGLPSNVLEQSGVFNATIVGLAEDWAEDMDILTVTGDTLLRQAAQWDTVNNLVDDWNRLQTYIVRTVPATQRKRRIGAGI